MTWPNGSIYKTTSSNLSTCHLADNDGMQAGTRSVSRAMRNSSPHGVELPQMSPCLYCQDSPGRCRHSYRWCQQGLCRAFSPPLRHTLPRLHQTTALSKGHGGARHNSVHCTTGTGRRDRCHMQHRPGKIHCNALQLNLSSVIHITLQGSGHTHVQNTSCCSTECEA